MKIICNYDEYTKINYAKFLCPIVKALGEVCHRGSVDCQTCISNYIDFVITERGEERPQGDWIEKVERRGCFAGDKTVYSYTCPFCGVKEFKKYPFCHCGADMRGGAEE